MIVGELIMKLRVDRLVSFLDQAETSVLVRKLVFHRLGGFANLGISKFGFSEKIPAMVKGMPTSTVTEEKEKKWK